MSAYDAVAIRCTVNPRVQQVGVHEVLRIRDRVRARSQLTVGQLLPGDGTRGDHAVTSRSRVGLAPPRLIKATRITLTITTTLTAKTVLRRITPTATIAVAATTPGITGAAAAMIALIGIRCYCGDVDVLPLAYV